MPNRHSTILSPTETQRRLYRDEGYFVLENAVPRDQLDELQAECMRFVHERRADHEKEFNLNVSVGKFFIEGVAEKSRIFHNFAFGEQMAGICRATIGDDAYLFYDQLVVKGPDNGQSFAWHQDSGYLSFPHRPYVTCWVALDDMTEANGTAYILPFSRAGTREMVPHRRDEKTTEMVGYFGPDPGDPVIVPAGSIAVFTSVTFHRSGLNSTSRFRRVYVIQYSPEPIYRPGTGELFGRADLVMRGGSRPTDAC